MKKRNPVAELTAMIDHITGNEALRDSLHRWVNRHISEVCFYERQDAQIEKEFKGSMDLIREDSMREANFKITQEIVKKAMMECEPYPVPPYYKEYQYKVMVIIP